MIVLGIHDGHDSSACLLGDGRVILASAEERRTNKKNYAGVPKESIKAIFDHSNIDPHHVDLVALGCRIRTTAPSREKKRIYPFLHFLAFLGRYQWSTSAGQWLLSRLQQRRELYEYLDKLGIQCPRITFDHHQTHAVSAYFHRPWEDNALVLTLDGAGDGICAAVWLGRDHDLRLIARTPKFHSIAAGLYSNITAHLGLTPYEHEYKIMGMAPYGQAKYCLSMLDGLFSVRGLEFRNHTNRGIASILRLLDQRLVRQRFDNIAAACQQLFENLVLQWVRNAIAATGVPRLCCAGGAFLNVKVNKLIRELPEVEKFYVYPASDDGGTSEGAAILGYLQAGRAAGQAAQLNLQKDMYLGLSFTDDQCLRALDACAAIQYQRMNQPAEEIADLLARNQVVARFAGREEWGPRALGNRSILADPRNMAIIRKLNFAIKLRDFWMPFAASILEEDQHIYINNLSGEPYFMIEAFDTRQPAGERIVAGTHPFDQTVRPQIVNGLNPEYRDIIRAFKRRTGIGAVLNTSFNLHGYPIVGSPQTALHTLLNSALDALALGPFLVRRKI